MLLIEPFYIEIQSIKTVNIYMHVFMYGIQCDSLINIYKENNFSHQAKKSYPSAPFVPSCMYSRTPNLYSVSKVQVYKTVLVSINMLY